MIRLRPYHLFAVIRQIHTGPTQEDNIFKGVPIITKKILDDPEQEITLVEGFDDACIHCTRYNIDPAGSIWGEGHSCPSALRVERAYMVAKDMERILRKLDKEFGDSMSAQDFLLLAAEKYPEKYADKPDSDYRKDYLTGVKKIKGMWGQH